MWPIAVVGHLPSQPETEDASAVRLAHCLRGLEAINPLFSSWIRCGKRHRSTVPRIVTSPPDEAELRAWICEGTEFESRDGRKHKIGYAIEALTPKDKPVRAHFWVSSEPAPWWLLNRLDDICRYRLRGACRPPEFRKPDRLVARRTADSRNDLEVQVGRSDTGWLAHPRTALWRPAGAIPERLDDTWTLRELLELTIRKTSSARDWPTAPCCSLRCEPKFSTAITRFTETRRSVFRRRLHRSIKHRMEAAIVRSCLRPEAMHRFSSVHRPVGILTRMRAILVLCTVWLASGGWVSGS